MPEPFARRLLGLPGRDAPSARAASLASSAASHNTPGLLRSRALDPPGIPPGNPPGIPPALDGGANLSPLTGIGAGRCPCGGPVGRKTRGRLAPLGGVERPRRKVRFARLIQRRVRAFQRTFGPRRLRRQIDADRIATQGGGAA
jgi:hypothetical protein